LVAAIGAGLALTLGGAAATAAPTAPQPSSTAASPVWRELTDQAGFAAPERCNLYQSPNNSRASICSVASFPSTGLTDGSYRGSLAGTDGGYVQIRIDNQVPRGIQTMRPDFRGIWADAGSVQFRVCGSTGGCGPWK
jgi:hypothetical protein